MAEIDANGSDFSLVIDDAQATPTFEPPPGWHVETHHVNPLEADVHLRPSSAPSTSAPALLTFPDIAQSNLALSPFLTQCRIAKAVQLDAACAHVHLCHPGHKLDAAALPASADMSVAAQASAVLELLDRLNLPRVVALAVGLGATVILRAAAKRPRAFAGLILISPALAATSAIERLGTRGESLLTRGLGLALPRPSRERLLSRWLADNNREENSLVESALLDDVDRLNVSNVARAMAADASRDDAAADIAKCNEMCKARLLVITGKSSNMRYHVADKIESFDPTKLSWLDIPEVGSLVHDESPERTVEAVSLFFKGLPGFS